MANRYARPQLRVNADAYIDESDIDSRGFLEVNLGADETVVGNSSSGATTTHMPTFDSTAPSDEQIWVYSASNSQWEATDPNLGGATQLIHSDSDDSTTISNTTTETTYDTSSATIPANTLQVGDVIIGEIYGLYQANAFNNGELTIRLKWGTTRLDTAGVCNAADSRTKYFHFRTHTWVDSIGASATLRTATTTRIFGNSICSYRNRLEATVDTTSSATLSFSAEWAFAAITNLTIARGVCFWLAHEQGAK